MGIKVSVEVNIDARKHLSQVKGDKLGKFTASTWHKLYAPFVPKDTGALMTTVAIMPWEIRHNAPYAASVYYNQDRQYSKDKNPLATAYWDKAAEPTQKPRLIDAMQAFIDSGKLGLGK